MNRLGKIVAYSMIIFISACFSGTELTQTWVNPSYDSATAKPFKKILVIAKIKDEETRRMAEDKIVTQFLTTGTAIQSYQFLGDTDTNMVEIESKLKDSAFDGILNMRMLKIDTKVTYRPDPLHGGYGAGWYIGYGSPYPEIPGYYAENETFFIETSIYSLAPSTLIWTGTTETVDPNSLAQTINDIIKVIKDELITKGIITENINTTK